MFVWCKQKKTKIITTLARIIWYYPAITIQFLLEPRITSKLIAKYDSDTKTESRSNLINAYNSKYLRNFTSELLFHQNNF